MYIVCVYLLVIHYELSYFVTPKINFIKRAKAIHNILNKENRQKQNTEQSTQKAECLKYWWLTNLTEKTQLRNRIPPTAEMIGTNTFCISQGKRVLFIHEDL